MNNRFNFQPAPVMDHAKDHVLAFFHQFQNEGDIPYFVERFAQRGEIEPDRFTDSVKDSMIRFLVGRGLRLTRADEPRFDQGEYDEYFALGYEHAVTTAAGEDDPIDQARRKGTAPEIGWDFTVDTFETIEEQGIVQENILAAGAIDYIYELGERMNVFRLADALVLNWSSGAIDVVNGTAASKLYRYWKLRDERSTPEERGLLYRRVLSKGQTKLLTRMVANEHFPDLWHNLMSAVANYIDKTEKIDDGAASSSPVSKASVYQATRELQYNLTEYSTGMAHMQAHEMYSQLTEAFELLGDPEIVAHFGGLRRKSLWTVIERLSKDEFGSSPNIAAVKSLAVDGNRVFRWIAEFNEATTDHQQFLDFLGHAESYILNSALVGDQAFDEDDDFDDEFDDDFDEFDDDF